MSNDEAKFILSAYRPDGRDADDPKMAQALEQAKRDPALRAWFERQQAYDAAMTAKVSEIVPPAGLREAILAGARASEAGATDASGTTELFPGREPKEVLAGPKRAWWAQPMWLAAAAAIVVVLSLGVWRVAPVRGGSFEEFAVNFVDKGFRLQKHSADVEALKTWLGEQHGPMPETLPTKFANLRALGCRTMEFNGHEVSLTCFEQGGKEFHVFVMRREETPGMVAEMRPRLLDGMKLAAATWMDAKNRYVLVSDGGMEAVKSVVML
jgi:hypothetical protein